MPTLTRQWRRHRHRSHIAYDLETTPITAGTPTPLYLTAYDGETLLSESLNSLESLRDSVIRHFLTPEHHRDVFVAYNANRFDALLIAKAIITDPDYVVEPWLTASGAFRGMRIYHTSNPRRGWRFSDAMAMFGFQGKLADFLAAFAPEYQKQSIDIRNFVATNSEHVAYAENDSVSLWHAVANASKALYEVTNIPPQNTIGKTAVMYFQSQIPRGVEVRAVPRMASRPLDYAKRGGYVHCAGRYRGPIWKYDVNQAYAAAMRNPLPAGTCVYVVGKEVPGKLGLYLCTIHRPERTAVPFYLRDEVGTPHWNRGDVTTGWLLSPEVTYLREYGWTVTVHRGWYWETSFDMSEMVDKLEYERTHCEGGPKGPLGLMIKAVGNNAFGKTLEKRDGARYVYTKTPPVDALPAAEEDPEFDDIWTVFDDKPREEPYHKPQLGIFITAYARLHLLRTAQQSPSTFLYADTDCIVFTNNMTSRLDIDKARYGAFKIEVNGESYGFLNKKVYYSLTTTTDNSGRVVPVERSCKGMHPGELTIDAWDRWYDGKLPKQLQTQRQQLARYLRKDILFVERVRTGSFVLPLFGTPWYT